MVRLCHPSSGMPQSLRTSRYLLITASTSFLISANSFVFMFYFIIVQNYHIATTKVVRLPNNYRAFSLVKLILPILQPKERLLLLYLAAEFFLRGHVGEVLGSIELVVGAESWVIGHVVVSVGAEEDADSGIVAVGTHQLIVHLHIHVHLAYILIG